MTQRNVDIAIVGGGMAGGFLAAALVESGLSVQVLDGAPAPVMPSQAAGLRVVTLTEASLNMLKATGIWQVMDSRRLSPYNRMQVWDSDGTGEVDFHAADIPAERLGCLVENAHVVAAAYQHLKDQPNIDWQSHCRVNAIHPEDAGWQIQLENGDAISCRLLVGADGGRSFVRTALGISTSHRDSDHHALVTALRTEKAHAACARQWFLTTGPLAFLPLFGDGHDISIVWSCVTDFAAELRGLPLDELARRLEQASDGMLGQIQVQQKPVGFPIRELHAASYTAPHAALVGDAAHVIHPLAGQGINLGLLDAAVLAEEITQAAQRGQNWWSEPLLTRYQRRRRGHNLMMQHSMRGFQTLFAQQNPALRWLRNSGMKWVNRTAPLKHFFGTEAMGRHGDLPAIARG